MSARARVVTTGRAVAICLLGLASGAAAADGAALFKAHCALCHGNGEAPRFVGRSADEVRRAIAEGKGRMRPVPLEAADADAIASFAADRGSAPAPAPGPNPAARTKVAKGDELSAAGNDQLALHAYLDAINLDPRDAQARLKLAAHYARMGHPQQAREQWEFALALDPGNAEAARNLQSSGAGRKP